MITPPANSFGYVANMTFAIALPADSPVMSLMFIVFSGN
jgi:hypothetical protein